LPLNGFSAVAKKFSTQLQRRRKDAQGARKETLQKLIARMYPYLRTLRRQTLH